MDISNNERKKKPFHHGLSISDLAPILQAIAGIFVLVLLITVFYNKGTTESNVFQVIMITLAAFIVTVGLVFTVFRIMHVRRRHKEHGIK